LRTDNLSRAYLEKLELRLDRFIPLLPFDRRDHSASV
jgi:hypothetical protein